MSIDVYYINGCAFLRTIARHIMYRATIAIKDAKSNTLFKKIKTIAGLYKVRGFTIRQIHGDNQFNCIKDALLNDLGIVFHACGANSHEPFIERDNRTSKERCRCGIRITTIQEMAKADDP